MVALPSPTLWQAIFIGYATYKLSGNLPRTKAIYSLFTLFYLNYAMTSLHDLEFLAAITMPDVGASNLCTVLIGSSCEEFL